MACNEDGDRINSFALVWYLPDPLGTLIDRLRRDLVPGCRARSHVTILPPRSLAVSPDDAAASIEARTHDIIPFPLELTEVKVFDQTSVIYIGVGDGQAQFKSLHDQLNQRALHLDEPYIYHPHVTLAQDLDPAEVPHLIDVARQEWDGFRGKARFEVEALTFVQNTQSNRWVDLKQIPLAEPVAQRRR